MCISWCEYVLVGQWKKNCTDLPKAFASKYRRGQTQILYVCFAFIFLLGNFRIFLNDFEFSVKVWLVLIFIFKFSEKKVLGHIDIFWNFKAQFARNFDVINFQKCLWIMFYTYLPMEPYHFIWKHHNHCTLVYTHYNTSHSLKIWSTKTTSPIVIFDSLCQSVVFIFP